MAEEDWRVTQDLLVKYGGLPKAVDLNKLYSNEFAEA
jgi:hypothetical protein